jgi:succinyl-CoA synthetase beta subunit
MKIHEYQAKELLAQYGVPIQRGAVAFSPQDVETIVADLKADAYVLKAQIHAGGRGKGGGIKLVKTNEDAVKQAKEMFGMKLVTPQTGTEGRIVRRLLVTEAADLETELYVGITLDRSNNRLVLMASTEGGVEIETVAAETPEKIIRETIDPSLGLQAYQARRVAFALGLSGDLFKQGTRFLLSLYKAFTELDCSLAEINPLVITSEGTLLALDVKLNIDDNALFRHPDIQAMRDVEEEEPLEVEATKHSLNYIKLDGTVGCMVNGAGLAMATMDIIKLAGEEPANFLDVGGGASAETVENGFRIILSDQNVKAILINIFGGIVRCDRVARGVIEAANRLDVSVPVVVRLAGTNATEASTLLAESDLDFLVANDLTEAAHNVTEALKRSNV